MARITAPMIKLALVIGIFCLHLGTAAVAQQSDLVVPDEPGGHVALTLPNDTVAIEPATALQVFTGARDRCCDGRAPVAGRYEVEGRVISFEPSFEFVTGQTYTIAVQTDASNVAPALTEFILSQPGGLANPEVLAIYPSGDLIPENTLRFYIHFSTPMQPHRSTEFIRLVDAAGVADTEAFMTFSQELWSEDRRRLTLLMDPGRIKRGVAQNLELGPALLEGNSYSLVVEAGWPSATTGEPVARFAQPFTASAALRLRPELEQWQFDAPRQMSMDPLVIYFDRPYDRELARRAISVLDADGAFIPGTVALENHQRTWRYEPDAPWTGAHVQIVVDAELEDVAGNNFRELLDHSLGTDLRDIDQVETTLALRPEPG